MGILYEFMKYRKETEFCYEEIDSIKGYILRRTKDGATPELLKKLTKTVLSEFDKKAQLTDKQREFWDCSDKRWNVKEGATRSGKTFLDYFNIPKRLMSANGSGLSVIIGNTQGTVNRNILEPMRRIWSDNLISPISPGDSTCRMFGKKVYILGADKVSAVSKLQGAGIEYCYGDEVTTWNEEVFSMLKSRLDKENSCFDGTCNPAGPNHWFLKFLESDADIFRQQYTIYDNKFLSPEFVTSLEKEYAGTVYFERFILGKWALAQGLVYPMFSKDEHIVSEIPASGQYYISIDYGTLNPCSMGLWCISGGKAYRMREYYYSGRDEKKQMTDEDYYEELVKLADSKVIQSVIIDPSAASFIATIKKHGKFTVRKAKNEVLDGIRLTGTFIKDGRILIHSSCTNTIREFESYSWDDKAQEDRVIKENDHAMDDIRYMANTILRREWS